MKKKANPLDAIVFCVLVIGVTTIFKAYMGIANAIFVGLAIGSSVFALYWCLKEYALMLFRRSKSV